MLLPATKSGDLVKEINRALLEAHSHVSPDQIWFGRLLKEAKQLLRVNAIEGHNVLAQLYGLAGDAEKARAHIEAALKLDQSAILQCNKATILSNLGFFVEAQAPFIAGASPERGLFTMRWKVGLCLGLIHTLKDFFAAARRMNLDYPAADAALVTRAVRLMDEIGLSDRKLGEVLDVAGEMLRSERLFFVGAGPEVSVWDEDALEKHLAIMFKVPVSNTAVIALDEELGYRLSEKCSDAPFELMLHFESGLPLNERFAERPAISG